MSEQDNLRKARETFEAWNAHNPARLRALLADEFLSESDAWPAPIRGREAAGQAMQMWVKAFPDLRLDVQHMMASGDYVVTQWHGTGTHKGELMGIAPTGRRGEGTRGCTIGQYRNGKLVHEWVYMDIATILRQIGALPAVARTTGA